MLTSAPAPQPHPEGGRCHFSVSIWAGPGSCFCPPTSLGHPLDKAAGTSPLPIASQPTRLLWTICFSVPPLCSASSEPQFLGDCPGPRQGLCHGSLVCSPVPSHPWSPSTISSLPPCCVLTQQPLLQTFTRSGDRVERQRLSNEPTQCGRPIKISLSCFRPRSALHKICHAIYMIG